MGVVENILIFVIVLGPSLFCLFLQCRSSRKIGKISDQISNTTEVMKKSTKELGLQFIDGGYLDDILHFIILEPLDSLSEDTFTQLKSIIDSTFKKKSRLIGLADEGLIQSKKSPDKKGKVLHFKFVLEKDEFTPQEFSFIKLRSTLTKYLDDLAILGNVQSIDMTMTKLTLTQLMHESQEKIPKADPSLISIIHKCSEAYFNRYATLVESKFGESEHILTSSDGEKKWAWNLITVFRLDSERIDSSSMVHDKPTRVEKVVAPVPKGTAWPPVCVGCANAKTDELQPFPYKFKRRGSAGWTYTPVQLFLCKDCKNDAESQTIPELERWNKLYSMSGIACVIVVVTYILLGNILAAMALFPGYIGAQIMFTGLLVVPSALGALVGTNEIRKLVTTIQSESPFLRFIDFDSLGIYYFADEEFFKIFQRLNPIRKAKLDKKRFKITFFKQGSRFLGFFGCGACCYILLFIFSVILFRPSP